MIKDEDRLKPRKNAQKGRRRVAKTHAKPLDVIFEEHELSEREDTSTLRIPFSLKRFLDDEATMTLSKKKGDLDPPTDGSGSEDQEDDNLASGQQTNRFPINLKTLVPTLAATIPLETKDKSSLRQKFGELLPSHLSLKIGYIHKRLIHKMCCIDRCLEFSFERSKNSKTFQFICEQVQSSMKVPISLTDLQQLLFFNHSLYDLAWEKKERLRGYNLMINFPTVIQREDPTKETLSLLDFSREDRRKENLRMAMVSHLKNCYIQYLGEKDLPCNEDDISSWMHEFSPDNVVVPLGELPKHPDERDLELRNLQSHTVSSISNPNLKQIVEATILNSRVPPRKQMTSEILNKKNPDAFKQKLYDLIKAKEMKLLEEKEQASAKKTTMAKGPEMIRFCQQACQLFISRRVGTMFLVNFVEAMARRTDQGLLNVQKMTEEVCSNGVGFLSMVNSDKARMLCVSSQKFKDVMSHYKDK